MYYSWEVARAGLVSRSLSGYDVGSHVCQLGSISGTGNVSRQLGSTSGNGSLDRQLDSHATRFLHSRPSYALPLVIEDLLPRDIGLAPINVVFIGAALLTFFLLMMVITNDNQNNVTSFGEPMRHNIRW